MSDAQQENDPSIEEILASIRQIISDDDEEAGAEGTQGEEEVAADPEPEPLPEPEPEDDVLELTEKADEVEEEIAAEPEPEPEPIPDPEPEPEPEDDLEVDLTEPDVEEEAPPVAADDLDTEILTQGAAAATLAGFTKLARDIQVNRSFDGITLEDIVRAQLEPLLREWLDKNLPPMIETLVEKELEKLSKKALND